MYPPSIIISLLTLRFREAYLSVLVRINYWLRARGKLPDEWYWADAELWTRMKERG